MGMAAVWMRAVKRAATSIATTMHRCKVTELANTVSQRLGGSVCRRGLALSIGSAEVVRFAMLKEGEFKVHRLTAYNEER